MGEQVSIDEEVFNPELHDVEPGQQIAVRPIAGGEILEQELTPRAIIPVDLFGLPAEHERILALAAPHGMVVIDDAAQAFGATRNDTPVGALAPLTATSFFPAKPLGAYGDGGAVFARDASTAHKLRSIRAHGKGDHKYEIVRVGVNGRLDTLQAAILLVKLDVFAEELKARSELAARYNQALAGAVQVPVVPEDCTSAWAQYSIVVPDREAVQASLREAGIPSAIYYPLPMHLQPAYAEYGSGKGSLPVSESLSQQILSLPMHPYMSDDVADRVTSAVLRGVDAA